MAPLKETDRTVRVTKQTFTYDDENKLTDARVERLGMKALTEPNVTTYHYEYDENGNRTLVEIKDDGLTLESTVYEYDRLNKMIRSREVTAKGLYIYEYRYDDNGNLISEDRHRAYETQPVFYTNIRRYEYTKDNKLEAVYSGNTLLVAYSYDGDGTITSTLDRDLDFNQNLNINDHSYMNRLTANQRQLINKVNPSDTILYELTEYVLERNQEYSQVLMERDGAGNLSTIYTYGNQRINSESYPNLSGLYTYDGRGSVSAVIGSWGDFRATYWYDGLGNVKSQVHGFGVFGSGKKYYGYNAEQYNPVTGNQNLRARQLNIRRQRFLSEDTYLGNKTDILSINRYIYARNNPLKYLDPSGYDYEYAMWLLNENGAHGAGHAAIILGDDEGQGEFYGYVGENTFAVLNPFKGVEGYVMTPIENGQTTKINMKEFFNSKGDYNNDGKMEWIIKNTDAITRPNSYIVDATNKKDMEFSIKNIDANGKTYYTSYDPYTYAIMIPITNDEGIAMHNKAIDIKENAGQYKLYYHNCNQIAQEILDAGGKRFDYSTGIGFNTMPNMVKYNFLSYINIYQSNDAIKEYSKYKYWKFGDIGSLGYEPKCSR